MKWKAVTRRTRIFASSALLCALAAAWIWHASHKNPCGRLTQLQPTTSAGSFRLAEYEAAQPHLLRVQDDDSSDDGMPPTFNPDTATRPTDEMTTHLAPCLASQNKSNRLFGLALSLSAVCTLGTLYSLGRDRRRYAKRLRGRARKEEYYRRLDAGMYPTPGEAPALRNKARDGVSDVCECGCGEAVFEGQRFVPGHAQMMRIELEERAGGLTALRNLVDQHASKDGQEDSARPQPKTTNG